MNKCNPRLLCGIMLITGSLNLKAQEKVTNLSSPIEVKSLTGKIWMDRNLGATQVARSSNDKASFGYLYQWGRSSDGHQKRSSFTTKKLAKSTFAENDKFIESTKFPTDWLKGATGINNPCPNGFRLPTASEFDEEIATWKTKNASGAFLSPLKLPMTGYRSNSDGKVTDSGYNGDYWTSTTTNSYSNGLYFDENSAATDAGGRGVGVAVRCIKN
jgi:uncharacterized protein (TIGR02145 family)